jgi:phage tail sheath protein FI
LLEYEEHFGGAHPQTFEVTLADESPYLPQSVVITGGESPYLMHPALRMFYGNGGGECYIVSVGDYETAPSASSLKDGLAKIRKVDEVTLIVIPDAKGITDNTQYHSLYVDAMSQCAELGDRFTICDVKPAPSSSTDPVGDAAQTFRDNIGTSNLAYGAAYYPYLNTSIPYAYNESGITFSHTATDAFDGLALDDVETLSTVLDLQDQLADAKQSVDDAVTTGKAGVKDEKLRQITIALSNAEKALTLATNAMNLVEDEAFTSSELDSAETTYEGVESTTFNTSSSNSELDDALDDLGSVVSDLDTAITDILAEINSETGINSARNSNIGTYFSNEFKAELNSLLNNMRLTLPPSSTMAGIYAKVDEDRGVWKSPANVSVNQVSGPAVKITMQENDDYNVHPTGKSINVIRSFTGKGTLVWGARTLDGNSNEWRYISVRRFFNMVEESVKKATSKFVFEPNDANTWVKVKAMIENFLTVQWRDGALMGAKAEDAFFVKVGLGETMTQEDVLNGKMIVEIGMAAVRPAEFIILRFSHKMIES